MSREPEKSLLALYWRAANVFAERARRQLGEAVHTSLIATCLTPERLLEMARGEFPIAGHILREGVVLYDDGTFERIRKDAVAVGGGNVG